MTLTPEHVWWCWRCGEEAAAPERPMCTKCPEPRAMDDLGFRVGFNGATYAYYSTYETALKDRRL